VLSSYGIIVATASIKLMPTSLENAATNVFPLGESVEKEKSIDRYSKITQFLSWPILFLIFNIFFKLEISGRNNLSNIKAPFLVISNHISFYDSFLFRLALGLFTPHLPLRFMAVKKFRWRFLNVLAYLKIVDIIYVLFGAFVIVPGRGITNNLKEARDILDAGGNIVMYPEGRINIEDGVAPFKKGSAVLARQAGVSILPLSFRLIKSPALRNTIKISIGYPFRIDKNRTDELNTEHLHDIVLDLYNKSK
jgi:1-acyl-sn-glycerol-3-phosphate acyltransferase